MRYYSLFLAIFFAVCAVSPAFAQSILVNEVGYEQSGPKRAVMQSSAAIADANAQIVNSGGTVVATFGLGTQTSVNGWNGLYYVVDFSEFKQAGKYKLKVGSAQSPEFSIGEKILQAETGAFQIGFFNKMRNTDEGDRNLGIYGGTSTQNIYGGWWDATGDPGKHLSHLSYANYFNPQQIPLVVWSLLHASELQPSVYGQAAKDEAAWGADYLLRSLSAAGYFYMSVFDEWGQGHREICAWSGEKGIRSAAYQSAMREGGGVSIAALARASKASISKDSSSAQYLAGAKRAYAHLKANPTAYQDDNTENIIDDYTGLLAATELYNATDEEQYLTDANTRAQSLLSRQSDEGWFYTIKKSGKNERPFYHAADEGLPVVALARYLEICKPENNQAIRSAIKKNLQWYAKITYERANPFEYAKMYGDASSGSNPGEIDIALGKSASASQSQDNFPPEKAFNGSKSNNDDRWSSYVSGAASNDNQWIRVDLESVYKVNKVILNWENAYGTKYNIETSLDGNSWAIVAEITNNSSGEKIHSFEAKEARYVRMYGKTRALEYGGFSLFNFKVYGEQLNQQPSTPHNARFFMPHDNETKYWWQGENARIASLSAAFIIGAPFAGSNYWADTLFSMATAQLDWILGKNPFGVSMMFGFGAKNYPNYPATRGLANIKGGICNGITGKDGNESAPEWKPYGDGEWQNWRWIEQWLPHNAWYLIAISSLSHRIDNPIIEEPEPIIAKNRPQLGIQINQRGGVLYMSSQKDVVWKVHNLQGKLLFSSNSRETNWNTGNFKGTVVVSAFNGSISESKFFILY